MSEQRDPPEEMSVRELMNRANTQKALVAAQRPSEASHEQERAERRRFFNELRLKWRRPQWK